MSEIDRNLISDERILFRTKKHLIIFFYPVVWTLFSVYAFAYMRSNPILNMVAFVPWLLAVIFWAYVGLQYLTSEFVVTNKRLIMREGFFNRHVNEMRLATISQINVSQSLLGQMFNYGMVSINAFGAFDAFTVLAKPYTFQKYVNEQLDKITR